MKSLQTPLVLSLLPQIRKKPLSGIVVGLRRRPGVGSPWPRPVGCSFEGGVSLEGVKSQKHDLLANIYKASTLPQAVPSSP